MIASFEELNATLPNLDIEIASVGLHETMPVGARYCSLGGQITAQILVEDSAGRRHTPYLTRDSAKLAPVEVGTIGSVVSTSTCGRVRVCCGGAPRRSEADARRQLRDGGAGDGCSPARPRGARCFGSSPSASTRSAGASSGRCTMCTPPPEDSDEEFRP
jgi:hypothetical protein